MTGFERIEAERKWLRDQLWLLIHCTWRERARLLRGRCIYCGRADCID